MFKPLAMELLLRSVMHAVRLCGRRRLSLGLQTVICLRSRSCEIQESFRRDSASVSFAPRQRPLVKPPAWFLLLALTVQARAFTDENWISMGGFPGANNTVRTVITDAAGNLYIGGDFLCAGDVAGRIAKWDGTRWSAMSSGVNGTVLTMAVSGTEIYVGGNFTIAGGIAATNLAKWNGSTWSALAPGITNPVLTLVNSGSDLYVGGVFTNAGGVPANRVARWNGSAWSGLGLGMDSYRPGLGHL